MVKWYHSGLLIRQFGVRIPVALPYKNTLPTAGGAQDMSIRVSVFLYGNVGQR